MNDEQLHSHVTSETTQHMGSFNFAVLNYSQKQVAEIFATFGGRGGMYPNTRAHSPEADIFYQSFDEHQDEIVRVMEFAMSMFAEGKLIAYDPTAPKHYLMLSSSFSPLHTRVVEKYNEGVSFVDASAEATLHVLRDFAQAYPQLLPALKAFIAKSAGAQGTVFALLVTAGPVLQDKSPFSSPIPSRHSGFQDTNPLNRTGRECKGMRFAAALIRETNAAKQIIGTFTREGQTTRRLGRLRTLQREITHMVEAL